MTSNGKLKRIWERLLDPQVMLMAGVFVVLLVVILFLGRALTPFFAAVVVAYLLDGLVRVLERRHIPRIIGVLLVFGLFFIAFIGVVIGLVPLVAKQLTQLAAEVPKIVVKLQGLIGQLQDRYLSLSEYQYVQKLIPRLAEKLEAFAGTLAAKTLLYIPGLLELTIYLILVPFLVFFFLKDKKLILNWMVRFIPSNNELLFQVLSDVDRQIGNFLRGKSLEIIVMTVSTTIVFWFLHFNYALLLGVLTGLSTIIPYVGVAVVTLPVLVLAYVQWGWDIHMVKVLTAYGILQIIDGNILAPLILGTSVQIHPTAIIFGILVCGTAWGFWGVMFAVPVISLVNSILDFALPYVLKNKQEPAPQPPGEGFLPEQDDGADGL